MATKTTRRQRAQRKPAVKPKAPAQRPAVKKPVAQKAASEQPYKFPNVLALTRQAVRPLWRNKPLFIGIAAIYSLLNILLVGVGSSANITALRDGFGNRFIGSTAAYSQLIGSAGSGTQTASVYQTILLVIMSLALIWTLRQVYAGYQPRLRDAFYQGMYPLVPCLIVIMVMLLQSLPAFAGLYLYQLALNGGLASNGLQIVIWSIVALALALLSLFFVAASLQAFYVAALPDMTPLAALRTARGLVKGRRWLVLRKILFLPLVLVFGAGVVTMPVIILAAGLAQFWILLVTPFIVVAAHGYLYALYRELVSRLEVAA